jgi:hypothetical protein
MNDNLNSYIDMINNYQKKLQALQQYKDHDKLAINDESELYIQSRSPWRYIVRRIKNQNRHILSFYLSNIINEYIKILDILLVRYAVNKEEVIIKLFNEVVDFIPKILWGIITLRNYYNLKSDSHYISLTLESINNRLNTILSKIKLAFYKKI